MTRQREAKPGGYTVRFGRSIKSGKKVHTIQVQKNELVAAGSGRSLAEAFRNAADSLDEKWNGGPIAAAVWGEDKNIGGGDDES